MAPESHQGASVLIVDPDAALRSMIETVLKHAGFRTVSAEDLDTAAAMLDISSFAVILRDLNLAPPERRRALQRLSATSPELLQRTIVMTTASARATTAVRTGTVFAIVDKPFDIENLVNAVRACARGWREADRRATRRTPPSPQSRQSERDTDPPVRLESVQRFVSAVPTLQQVLSVPVSCQREAVLRAEMRRALGVLSATLLEAAHDEASRTRAAVLRGASTVAARLAHGAAPAIATAAGGSRDH